MTLGDAQGPYMRILQTMPEESEDSSLTCMLSAIRASASTHMDETIDESEFYVGTRLCLLQVAV